MTVITIKDGVLACDSGATAYGVHVGTVSKARRLGDGSVVAVSGHMEQASHLLSQMEQDGRAEIAGDEVCAAWLMPDGGIRVLDGPCPEWAEIEAPFFALGSGSALAYGAMAAGASAERAVEIACDMATDCRGPVRTFKAGERP